MPGTGDVIPVKCHHLKLTEDCTQSKSLSLTIVSKDFMICFPSFLGSFALLMFVNEKDIYIYIFLVVKGGTSILYIKQCSTVPDD